MKASHSLLIVDDDVLVRSTCRRFFAAQEEFEVCAEGRDGSEGVDLYDRHQPDVLLMDLQMPVMDGVAATREIIAQHPGACIVIMTSFDPLDQVLAALSAGAAGYLLKDVGGPGLVSGLHQAMAGDMPLSPSVRKDMVAAMVDRHAARPAPKEAAVQLKSRELEVLGLLARGMSNQEIGAAMYVSDSSVKQTLLAIGRKLGVRSRTSILVKALQLGLVDLESVPLDA